MNTFNELMATATTGVVSGPIASAAASLAFEVRVTTKVRAGDHCSRLVLLPGFLHGESAERHGILLQPARKTVSSELVWVDDHLIESDADRAILRLLLRRELEPFIIGVGEVEVVDGGLSECLKVMLRYPRLDPRHA
jgi:hypothetical protein